MELQLVLVRVNVVVSVLDVAVLLFDSCVVDVEVDDDAVNVVMVVVVGIKAGFANNSCAISPITSTFVFHAGSLGILLRASSRM